MFSEFENMFKKHAQKITKSVPLDLLGNIEEKEYAKTPQKFNINGRQIIQKKLLAEGAFGFIWIAEDVNTKQQFALKRVICMTEDKVKSALLEKSLMQKLPSSPYVVKYYGGAVLKHDGNTVVVTLMQLCPGGNLFDMLQKYEGKGIPEQTVKKIATSVLNGLSALHKAGFIHRDIKIQNILVGKDKNMKICDFGSCTTQIIDFSQIPKSDYDHVRESIQSFTTPMYRPPEIVDPYLRYKVTGKADIWMLGCVLYTMSYFTHPFVEASAVGIAGAVYRYPHYPQQTNYKISQKMQDYIRNFLTPNPDYRPSPQKLLQILNKWQDLPSIPLNQEAKRLKKEQQEKEEELKKLNKKVSKYDGDIPMQQLIKLQSKLVNNNKESFQQDKFSFIKDRDTERIGYGGLSAVKSKPVSANNGKDNGFIDKHASSAIVSKKTSNVGNPSSSKNPNMDIWSNDFTTSKPSSSSSSSSSSNTKQTNFDIFNDVFSNIASGKNMQQKKQVQPNSQNTANFHEFFHEIASSSSTTNATTTASSTKNNKTNEVNLLDL